MTTHCGGMGFGGLLREYRDRRGWSLADLAGATHYTRGYLCNVECGRKPPTEDVARLCDRALGAGGELVAAARLDVIRRLDETPGQTAELIGRLRASDTSWATIDSLHSTVSGLCCQYPYRDALELRGEAHGWLDHIVNLLRRPAGLREHTELLVAAGWLALLTGCLEYDLGMRAAAESTRAAARQLGTEAGHAGILGWAHEMSAWFALTQGRYADAVVAARAGQAIVTTDGGTDGVQVQLVAQEAKALAGMGRPELDLASLLERGRATLDRLPAPERPDHHFQIDPAKWDLYAMDIHRIAGDDVLAKEHATAVLDHHDPDNQTDNQMDNQTDNGADNGAETGDGRAPMRLAEARLTLAAVACRCGDLEGAVELGLAALTTQRRSLPSMLPQAGELARELHHRCPGEPLTDQFHEALRGWGPTR